MSSICEKCAVPIPDCSWMSRLEPVDGWKAHRTAESYRVRSCPNFIQAQTKAIESPEEKPKLTEAVCPVCKKVFLKKIVRGGGKKYCSEICRGRAATKRYFERMRRENKV